jgi:hypothetical protein
MFAAAYFASGIIIALYVRFIFEKKPEPILLWIVLIFFWPVPVLMGLGWKILKFLEYEI